MYHTWLFWSYSGRYPGIPRVYTLRYILMGTRVPNLVVLVILGVLHLVVLVILEYQSWLFWSYSGRYPGIPGVHLLINTPLISNYFIERSHFD